MTPGPNLSRRFLSKAGDVVFGGCMILAVAEAVITVLLAYRSPWAMVIEIAAAILSPLTMGLYIWVVWKVFEKSL